MKNFTFTAFLLLFFSVGVFAQEKTTLSGTISFDSPSPNFWIIYDSGHVNNIWQVGKPNKTTFTAAHTAPNCIVTDTLNPYPVNDTSVFIIGQSASNGWAYPGIVLFEGYFQVFSDTLKDYGTIEVSPDNGINWIDVLNDTLYNIAGTKPVLSGNSGWSHFSLDLSTIARSFNVDYFDSILYRFGFISDSIQTNKDGLMYDDLYFFDDAEGIPTISPSKFISTIYPNPSSSFINISFETISSHSYSLSVYDCSGRIVRRMEKIKDHKLSLTTNDFPPGMYHYTIRDEQDGKYSDGKFMVVH